MPEKRKFFCTVTFESVSVWEGFWFVCKKVWPSYAIRNAWGWKFRSSQELKDGNKKFTRSTSSVALDWNPISVKEKLGAVNLLDFTNFNSLFRLAPGERLAVRTLRTALRCAASPLKSASVCSITGLHWMQFANHYSPPSRPAGYTHWVYPPPRSTSIRVPTRGSHFLCERRQSSD